MLEICSIRKSYGYSRVLAGVDLEIKAGEFFALLGPSGCGKTTLLRTLGGFEQADAGEIKLDGQRIDLLPPHQRPCHMVFQRYALFPHLDVKKNVAFALNLRRLPKREIENRVDEVLGLVEMQAFADRRISTLSGGQQQRVALARALANRPRFLLLDEPLSALDLKLRQRMQVELVQLQRRLSITFIFVTHDQEEAMTLADRVAIMRAGQIEQVGSPEAVYRDPATPFVANFLGQVHEMEGRIVSGDEAEIDGLGKLSIKACQLPLGGLAKILIRPEHLQLSTTPKGQHIQVVVEHLLFKGPYVDAIVHCKNRPDLRLSVHAVDPARLGLVPGAQAFVIWPSGQALAFPFGVHYGE